MYTIENEDSIKSFMRHYVDGSMNTTMDLGLLEKISDFPYCLIIDMPIKHPDDNGWATTSDYDWQ